ncbi:MAG: hypothetical protein AABX34_06865 [Nanoarchaeota archaeon]
MDLEIIKRIILEHLITPPRWGGKHIELRNHGNRRFPGHRKSLIFACLKKGFPSNIYNSKEGQKLIDKAIKELVNSGILLCKKSAGELHMSLNPRMKKEIMELIVK